MIGQLDFEEAWAKLWHLVAAGDAAGSAKLVIFIGDAIHDSNDLDITPVMLAQVPKDLRLSMALNFMTAMSIYIERLV